MSGLHTVKESLQVIDETGKVTASIDLTLGDMKIGDVLDREIARCEELAAALKTQKASLPVA